MDDKNMINVIAIPYNNFKDKIRIIKENSGINFSDCNGVLVNYEYSEDELSAWMICKKDKNCR